MTSPVQDKLASYPPQVLNKVEQVKRLIFDVATEKQLGPVTESLKWGELSYACKGGSPIRLDWKQKCPEQVSLFFNCNTVLVETFREIYGSQLTLIGKRELALSLTETIPELELRACIAMALQYHKLKSLPLLGA